MFRVLTLTHLWLLSQMNSLCVTAIRSADLGMSSMHIWCTKLVQRNWSQRISFSVHRVAQTGRRCTISHQPIQNQKLYNLQKNHFFMYQPSQQILDKYADVLVKFALNSGKGVKKGEVVMIAVDDVAKPLLVSLYKKVLEAGAFPLLHMSPTGISKTFFDLADKQQLTFFPKAYLKARADLIDHQIVIHSETDPRELQKVDPKKIFMSSDARKLAREWLNDKENNGKFTWTLALYGTEAMAKEAGMSLKQYWDTIIKGCYLDKKNPIQEWRNIFKIQEITKKKLNALKIDYLHMRGKNCDLKIKIGKNRKWLGGSGRNIPSFELFISPDWLGIEGFIHFNQPLYRYGNLIKNISLEFKNGRVVKATASSGQKLLQDMIKRKNADKVGEYSLTDKRLSRITKFTANTLFDENIGGEYGNTHCALGMAYKDSYTGDPSKPSKAQWDKMGFNDSAEHCDIISTEDRTVTAHLMNGKTKVIYRNGMFVV